jgi:Arf-GAP/coiled-coil/ANK repeat/PH domain-containing protein
MAGFMAASGALFQQGGRVFTDIDPFLRELGQSIQVERHTALIFLQGMRESSQVLEKQLEKRHTYVTQSDLASFTAASEAGEALAPLAALSPAGERGKAVMIEGYLFKRGQNAFRTWNRRWFYLTNNKVSPFPTPLISNPVLAALLFEAQRRGRDCDGGGPADLPCTSSHRQ